MIEVKICGMTNKADALAACEAGADAVGFIFFPQSPRYILPEQALKIIRSLPLEVCKVGVFVNTDQANLQDIVDYCGLDLIQLHGSESAEFCRLFPAARVIKSLSPHTLADIEAADVYETRAILVDAPRLVRDGEAGDPQYGGTGRLANWEMAKALKARHRLILAGGLKADNVAEAIAAVEPDALDFNSGVEISPRHKDLEKIRRVIELVRRIDSEKAVTKEKIFTRLES